MARVYIIDDKEVTATAEQSAAIDHVLSTGRRKHVSLVARAGAAKTTTLIMLARELKNKEIMCLAFNKAIKDEMAARLPFNCEAFTLNGLGHKYLSKYIRAKYRAQLKLERSKTYDIFSAYVGELSKAQASILWDNFGEIAGAVGHAKGMGYCGERPERFDRDVTPRANWPQVEASFEENFSILETEAIQAICATSFSMLTDGVIDFDDQILALACLPLSLPSPDVVLVDEAQDLSALNHIILQKLTTMGRLIAVGDPCQAIYGFRGAHEESMDELTDMFNMRELKLTTTFRCSQAVCAEALWRAPDMVTPSWAKRGSVETWLDFEFERLDGPVLCRYNAPLIRMTVQMLKDGHPVEYVGHDILAQLKKLIKKFKGKTKDELLDEAAAWEREALERYKNQGLARDKAACLRLLLVGNKRESLAYADELLNTKGRLKLMTIHKAKGLEWDTVHILDQELISWEGQDPNLRYVAQTRAKDNLVYISPEGYRR